MSASPPAPIILIGGANGSGKTWLAGRAGAELRLNHHLGTGFVREVLRSETTPEREPALFDYSFAGPDPVRTLDRQADRLFNAVRRCIERARTEGTSLIVEGTHIVPRRYADLAGVDLYLMLRIPGDADQLRARATGASHSRREIVPGDLSAIRMLDKHLTTEASQFGISVLDSTTALDRLMNSFSPSFG